MNKSKINYFYAPFLSLYSLFMLHISNYSSANISIKFHKGRKYIGNYSWYILGTQHICFKQMNGQMTKIISNLYKVLTVCHILF
jgi:fucose 4-O-acetylase-like acetyltransferase